MEVKEQNGQSSEKTGSPGHARSFGINLCDKNRNIIFPPLII